MMLHRFSIFCCTALVGMTLMSPEGDATSFDDKPRWHVRQVRAWCLGYREASPSLPIDVRRECARVE
jgi:hypothetical protein